MAVRSKTIEIIIFIQLCAILFLSARIIYRLKQSPSVNPIPSHTVTMNGASMLSYYYEPVPGTTIADRKNWMSEEAKYTINQDGLNERFDYAVDKKPGIYRIITLGDSFTYGTNVSTGDNWTELLEDLLNRTYRCRSVSAYEVINLGVGGYDVQFQSERYRRKGINTTATLLSGTSRISTALQEKCFRSLN